MKKVLSLLLLLAFISAFSQKEEAVMDSGNSKLHYKIYGSGKPILIINGGPGMNCEGFGNVADEISKFGYQTIIYDQRGTGKSTVKNIDSKNISMDLMVEDMENLRKQLNIKTWSILGHSFGGIMAAYYTSKHPETIDKLIFSSSGGINMGFTRYAQSRIRNNMTPLQRDSVAYFERKINAGDTSLETRKKRASYLANAYVYDKSKAPVIAERLIQVNFDVNQIVFQNLLDIKFDCSKNFKNFKKPVLILQGENDIISLETAEEIKTAFPNSKLVALKNCGHYGWLDAKDIYFKTLQHFLKG